MNSAIYRKIRALALLSLLAAGSASAHHSAAMYDNNKVAEVSGTIKRVQIGNPHSWFWIQVANATGGSDLWGFEGGSVADVSRKSGGGSATDYFAVGQKVKVSFHPLRDGRQSGELLTITFEDGRVFGGGGPGGPPPAAPSPGTPQ